MARKRKQSKKKYFWQELYVGTLPEFHAKLQDIVAHVRRSDRIVMLDQGRKHKVTQETLVNALFVWLHELYHNGGGMKAVEEQLRRPLAIVEMIVQEDMRKRADEEEAARDADGEPAVLEPEGFSVPGVEA